MEQLAKKKKMKIIWTFLTLLTLEKKFWAVEAEKQWNPKIFVFVWTFSDLCEEKGVVERVAGWVSNESKFAKVQHFFWLRTNFFFVITRRARVVRTFDRALNDSTEFLAKNQIFLRIFTYCFSRHVSSLFWHFHIII